MRPDVDPLNGDIPWSPSNAQTRPNSETQSNQLQRSFPNTFCLPECLYHCLQAWYSKLACTDFTPVELRWRTGANRGQPVPGALPGVGSKSREPFHGVLNTPWNGLTSVFVNFSLEHLIGQTNCTRLWVQVDVIRFCWSYDQVIFFYKKKKSSFEMHMFWKSVNNTLR